MYIFEASKEKRIGLFVVWRQLEKYQDEEMEVYNKYKKRALAPPPLSLSLKLNYKGKLRWDMGTWERNQPSWAL
jgi:hypothetical protein